MDENTTNVNTRNNEGRTIGLVRIPVCNIIALSARSSRSEMRCEPSNGGWFNYKKEAVFSDSLELSHQISFRFTTEVRR